jgi:hypothetical protein
VCGGSTTHNQCCKVARQKFWPKSSKGATEKKNLIFNIQGIVKLMFLEICRAFSQIAKIRPQIFISAAPFELFGRNFCHLATLGTLS